MKVVSPEAEIAEGTAVGMSVIGEFVVGRLVIGGAVMGLSVIGGFVVGETDVVAELELVVTKK